jgi:uncharacterized paraquat-inducible protein A
MRYRNLVVAYLRNRVTCDLEYVHYVVVVAKYVDVATVCIGPDAAEVVYPRRLVVAVIVCVADVEISY